MARFNIPLTTFNLGFEFLRKFQLVLKQIFQPVTKLRLLFQREHLHIRLDLFQSFHIQLKQIHLKHGFVKSVCRLVIPKGASQLFSEAESVSRRDILIIARRFNAGTARLWGLVPIGTVDAGGFSAVPAGTFIFHVRTRR